MELRAGGPGRDPAEVGPSALAQLFPLKRRPRRTVITLGAPPSHTTPASRRQHHTLQTADADNDGHSHPAQLRSAGDYATLNYADTTQSGIYVARFGPPVNHSETFAVNVDTAESDLTQIDPEELQNEVWPGIPFLHQTSWQDFAATAGGSPIRSGSRLHVGLLYALLGLLFVETFLGWKMGYHQRRGGQPPVETGDLLRTEK